VTSASLTSEPKWRKSTYSNAGNQCVEIGWIGATIAVRDSKNPTGDHLTFGITQWRAFLTSIKNGTYDCE
jgi:Domain of unknown function (DUF397)